MFTEKQLKSFAIFLNTGIVGTLEFNNEYIRNCVNVLNKCPVKTEDSEIMKVFKAFIFHGNPSDTNRALNNRYGASGVSDIIFFRQCEDIEITLVAKAIYAYSGTKYSPFLKIQVEKILKDGEICIRDEYAKWWASKHGGLEKADALKIQKFDFE